jgi:hypothetical protein
MLDLASLSVLQSTAGQACLAEARLLQPTEATFLILAQRLARRYPERLARLSLEQVLLRQRAAAKFPSADRMFFTRQGLEQATHSAVAKARASRFTGFKRIFDLCSGIGGDALALEEFGPVIAVDQDRLAAAVLQANALSLGRESRIRAVVADVRHLPWRFGRQAGAFFDPSRRDDLRRLRRSEHYHPALSTIRGWLDEVAGLGVKVGPAVDRAELGGYACEVEFVSLDGDLKEASLWFGALQTADVRATVLPGPHTLTGPPVRAGRLAPPQQYIYEPDPAVLRAGLVGNLAERLEAAQLDPTIAYLTSSVLATTPFARAYEVLQHFPFSRKRLQAALQALEAGEVTLKKRGSPVDTEALGRRLRLTGERPLTVLLTRVADVHSALIVVPMPHV